jgi:sn-glycerol 3-phosphate transport system ATP-binding protein
MLVVMNGGVVEQVGKPMEIYRRPETTFVATFIGAPPMNLLSLKQSPGIGGLSGLPADAGIVGVRPEDLAFNGGKADSGVALELKVEAVERIGAETFVYGHHNDAGEILVRMPGESAPPIGETITATATRAKLHVFTGDGRRRIDL